MALNETMKSHRSQRTLSVACTVLAAAVLGACTAPAPRTDPGAGPRERAVVTPEPRRLLGLYRYMSGSASFFDCASGDQFPLAPDGQAPALQAAYAATRAVPGEPRLATVEARIVRRVLEPGGTPRPALLIERVIGVSTLTACTEPG
jgi:hypothetical protein